MMYKDEFYRHRVVSLATLVLIISFFLVARPAPATARFVLSSQTWSYPDEYGQGIEYVYFIVDKPYGTPVNWSYQYYNGTESAGLDFPNNCSVFMKVAVWLNGTLHGYTYAEGRDLYTRVGIVVSHLGETVFSQGNLTQAGGSSADDPMWLYYYTILLHGDPEWLGPAWQAGLVYTVVVTYDIFMEP